MSIGRCPPAAAFRVCLLGMALGWASVGSAPSDALASTPSARAKGEDFQTTGTPARAATKTSAIASPGALSQVLTGPTIVNVPVCVAIYDQFGPQMVPDGVSGSILVWQDYRSGLLDIYAQRVNDGGVVEWPADGVPVCKAAGNQSSPRLVSDGAGGAIVVWQDARLDTVTDIYAQRISGTGVPLWGNGGVAVCTSPRNQTAPVIAPDGLGGAVIAWVDERGTDADVYAQRLNGNGVAQWTANGIAVCTAAGAQQSLSVTTDALAGALVIWQDARAGDANADVYARRVDAAGTAQWAANGVPLCVAAGVQSNPAAVADGAGGLIAVWQDHRGAGDDVYVQRLNGAGAPQWTVDGVAVGAATGDQQAPKLCSDGAAGAIAVWEDRRGGGADIYAQRVNAAGAPQWAANGVGVCLAVTDQLSPSIFLDVTGGAAIAWSDLRDPADGIDIYVQHVQPNGAMLWTADGVLLSNAAGTQEVPVLVADGTGGAAVAWRDFRAGIFSDVYYQRVNAAGQVPDQCVPPDSLANEFNYLTTATQNYRTFQQGYFYFGAVGVRGSPGTDWDIEVFDQGGVGLEPYPACFGLPLAGSYARDGVDFVVGDFNDLRTPPGTYGARVYLHSGAGSGMIEYDGGPGLIPKADNVNPNNGVGKNGWSEVIDCFDADLTAGNTYWFDLTHDPGMDLHLYVFSSYGAPSFYYVVPRSAAVLETRGRFLPFVAPSTQPYGVVITNENGVAGNYFLKVWTVTPVGVGEDLLPRRAGIRGVSPNPSAGRTHIEFAIHERGVASFEILDMAGRVVSRIPGRAWDPGVWSVDWDGQSEAGGRLAAGVYFVQMKLGQQRVGFGRIALVR